MIFQGEKINIPSESIFDMLLNSAKAHGDSCATIFAGHELTYSQLLENTLLLMGKLQDTGVKQGDRIGIMLPNCPQYVIAYYAITGLGATVVQVNPMSTAPELRYLVEDSGLTRLILFEAFIDTAKHVRQEVTIQQLIGVRFDATKAILSDNDVWLDEWLAHATNPGLPAELDPATTVAVLQYTGGTTGQPKGAMLSHRNVVSNAYQTQHIFPGGVNRQDMGIVALPLFHVYAMTVCMNLMVLNGLPMLIVPRFNVQEVLELIRQYKPTLFPGVPTMYVALAHAIPEGSDDLRDLRVCNSGGAPLPLEVMSEFERVSGAVVLEGYGLSESSPVTHSNFSTSERKVGSIGKTLPNTETKIVDTEDSHRMLGLGEEGELAIRGPQVMLGYWNRPEETAKTIQDGWLLTGDIAKVDEDGFVYIVDRKKDMIIASGFNVYPREVEEALYRHPAVLEAAVVGIADDYRGESVKAFIVLNPGANATAEELIAFCRTQLAAYKVPRDIELRKELPKSAVGKILRRALKS